MQVKHDIRSREDILVLLGQFYNKVLADDSINYIFIDVAKMDIKEHIPIIADFWETVLFQKSSYRKNAVGIHLELNQKSPLTRQHFDTWLAHFNSTVDELFTGENAFRIRQKAASIATIMQIKIKQVTR
jgi:hemoglobin